MGGRQLTKAQRRYLEKLAAMHPDACLTLECVDRGATNWPLFRARLKSVPCPTCGHPTKEEPVVWDVVEALDKAGLVAERLRGSGYFYITPAGRTALATESPSPRQSPGETV